MNIKKVFSNLKKFTGINLKQGKSEQNELDFKLNADAKTNEFCAICNLLPAIKNNDMFKQFMNNISDFSYKSADTKSFLSKADLKYTFGNIVMQDGSLYDFKSLVQSKNEDIILSDNQSLQSLNFIPKQPIEKDKEHEILGFMAYAIDNPFYNSNDEKIENKFLTLVRVSKSYYRKEQQISYFDNFGNWLATDFLKIIKNPENKSDYLHTVVLDNGIKNILKNEALEVSESTFKQKPQRVWYLPEKYYTNKIPVYEYLISKLESERRIINPFNTMPNGKKVCFTLPGVSINLNDIENKLAILNTYESEVGNFDVDFDVLSKK